MQIQNLLQDNNELFIQRFIQYSQEEKDYELHYRVLRFNDSWTEDDIKKYYRSLALQFHPDKNQHSQVSDVIKMINKAKEELEVILRHNDVIREEERFRMDAMREEERVPMAQNTIIILSESSS